jgi:hypothetical protein
MPHLQADNAVLPFRRRDGSPKVEAEISIRLEVRITLARRPSDPDSGAAEAAFTTEWSLPAADGRRLG